MTILIVADRNDWPTDRVVKALQDRGAAVFRMDTADFPQDLELTARIDREPCWRGTLWNAFRDVRLEDVTAVYYRAPSSFDFPHGMSEAERTFAFAQARAGVGGVLSTLECQWVNHPAAIARAEYKPVQLAAAREAGLTVPPTLITNSAVAVREFAREYPSIVAKTLGSPVVRDAEAGLCTIYSRPLGEEALQDLSGVETTAHLFQAWVDKAYEVRVTVVGEKQFAARIYANSPSAYEDWRSDYGALRYEPDEMPRAEEAALRQLMSALNLRFGAADFVVGPDGQWTFLEVNPCGQWDWIEHETGHPLTAAIADELQRSAT